MSEHMTSVDTVCSPCYVEVVDSGEFDDERPAKPEALVAAVHSGDNSHIIHFPAGGYSGFILHLSTGLSARIYNIFLSQQNSFSRLISRL